MRERERERGREAWRERVYLWEGAEKLKKKRNTTHSHTRIAIDTT